MAFAYGPIATLWGALAASHGLSPLQAMAMSFWVYSGAAQFVALDLFKAGLAPALIIFTIFTVSLRHVLMSASIARHMSVWQRGKASLLLFWLTDEAWAMLERRAGSREITPWYFAGVALPIWPVWFVFSGVGAAFGAQLGDTARWGLDFSFAALFIVVLAGFWKGSRTAFVLVASGAAAVLTKLFVSGAWYILVGGLAGMLVAVVLARPTGEIRGA
jgi:4-azaleucine resistance transporter AzlC